MKNPVPVYWEKLYAAAVEFKQACCWEWMNDGDIFGVQDPVSGEIGYCVILGSMGEVFALAVYRGTEGLAGITKLHTGMIDLDLEESMQLQNCLIASFEDREDLQERDREMIKKTGLKFRGRKEWPLFRSLMPGYVPWFLNKEEAVFLTIALQQATDIALKVKENPQLLTSANSDEYLVRTAEKKGRKTIWKDRYIKPELIDKVDSQSYVIDELRIKRIKKAASLRGTTLEVDFFYAPYPVQERKGKRPYFPYLCLWVDRKSGLVLKHCLAKHEELMEIFKETFIRLVEELKVVPTSVLVRREEAREMLTPLANALDIEIEMVKRLEMMDEVRENMFAYFSQ